MNELQTEIFISQVERLQALKLEELNNAIASLTLVVKSVDKAQNGINNELQNAKFLADLKEVKINHVHKKEVHINVIEKGFLAMIITTIIACLIAIGSFWYASSAKKEKKEAYFVREWADFGRYVLQDSKVFNEKTKNKLQSEYGKLRKLNKGELLR